MKPPSRCGRCGWDKSLIIAKQPNPDGAIEWLCIVCLVKAFGLKE